MRYDRPVSAAATGSSDDLQIGFGELVAEAKEGLLGDFGRRISETVPEVQACPMSPFSKAPVSVDRQSVMLLGEGDDDQASFFNQAGKKGASRDAQPGRKHYPGFC